MSTEYREMSVETLVDLLAQETKKLPQLEYTLDYKPCRERIVQIQLAIEAKKKTAMFGQSPDLTTSAIS